MSNSPTFLLAVSGVFLVAWYGVRRVNRQNGPKLPVCEHGSPEYRLMADSAIAAEFYEPPEEDDPLPGGTVRCEDCHAVYPAGVLYCECGGETEEAEEESLSSEGFDDSVDVMVEDEEKLVCAYISCIVNKIIRIIKNTLKNRIKMKTNIRQ